MSARATDWQDPAIDPPPQPDPRGHAPGEDPSSADGDPTLESDANSDDAPDGVTHGLPTGAHLGRYTVLRRLGAGAMGVVYSAYDPDLDRRVAIKILHPRSRAARDGGEEGKLRLLREAKALARLSHPNVVAIHDVGTIGSRVFLAMEFVDGQTLGAWLKAAPRGWREVLKTLIAAGDGLQAAHEAGLVHRDFKPENVSLGADGRVRVLDFGLARAAASDGEYPDPSASLSQDRSASVDLGITSTGVMVGTPAYMSPEQHLGRAADARSDQFAFCVTLYLSLYGERPFAGDNVSALQASVIQNKIRPPKPGTRVPKWLRRAILRGLAVDPDARYPSMEALLARLRDDPARRFRRRTGLAVVPALLVGVAVGTFGRTPVVPCSADREAVENHWNDERRENLRRGFLGTGFEHAERTWESAERLLDGYAASWGTMRRIACEATEVHHIQPQETLDLRNACLERRLVEFGALLEFLGTPTAAVVGGAVEMIGDLTPVDACADLEALESAAPEPTEKDARLKLDEARRHLLDARVYEETGQTALARQFAQRGLDVAVALDYAPLRADALIAVAGFRDRAGEHDGALEALHEAAQLSATSGHDEGLVSALIDTATSIAFHDANSHAALVVADVADVSLTRASVQGRTLTSRAVLRARLDVGYIVVLRKLKRYEEAKARAEEALDRVEKALEPGHPIAIRARTLLGLINLLDLGKYDDARAEFQTALVAARVLTGDNQRVAAILNNLSEVERRAHNLDKALEYVNAALAIRERVDRQHLAYSLQQLASVESDLKRQSDAATHYAEALQRYEDEHIRDPAMRAELYNNLAALDYDREDFESTRRHLSLALESFIEANGPDHRESAITESNYAELLFALGERPEATEHMAHAARILRALPGEGVELAQTFLRISDTLLGQGEAGLAERYLDDALPLVAGDAPQNVLVRARVRERLARAILARKDVDDDARARALEHVRAALIDLGRTDPADPELAASLENLEASLR